jgi:hypothetical protein
MQALLINTPLTRETNPDNLLITRGGGAVALKIFNTRPMSMEPKLTRRPITGVSLCHTLF